MTALKRSAVAVDAGSMKCISIHPPSALAGSGLVGLVLIATGAVQGPGTVAARQVLTAQQATILSHMRLVDSPDSSGSLHLTLLIEGLNVQIATGDADHYSSMATGNLVIGYPQAAPSGSHNILQGEGARIDRSNSCAVMGSASGVYDSIDCKVMAFNSWVSNGMGDSILGGDSNSIQNLEPSSYHFNVIVGGTGNTACSDFAGVMVGGASNTLSGSGFGNLVAGGVQNELGNERGICGPAGSYYGCAILGGNGNWLHGALPSTTGATLGGGNNREVTGDYDWRAGSLFEDE